MTEFVEVKTADLVGAALDWAVAKAEGLNCRLWKKGSAPGYCVIIVSTFFCPATKWADCGPLLTKYQIEFAADPDRNQSMCASLAEWRRYGRSHRTRWSDGENHLIAACRAIVASLLGETVSVPKELMS